MMARSYKHFPCFRSLSQKTEKRLANRAFRRRTRIKIAAHREEDCPHHVRCVSNVWCWPSDGLRYILDPGDDASWSHWYRKRLRK